MNIAKVRFLKRKNYLVNNYYIYESKKSAMAVDYTLTIIKPHAVRNNYTGPILNLISQAGFKITAMKMTRLDRNQTEKFYKEHKGRYFYDPLVEMMSSGPVIVAILEKDNAVIEFRNLVGNTDPDKAADGTLRKSFGISMRENAVHASDSSESAFRECRFFFSDMERY